MHKNSRQSAIKELVSILGRKKNIIEGLLAYDRLILRIKDLETCLGRIYDHETERLGVCKNKNCFCVRCQSRKALKDKISIY